MDQRPSIEQLLKSKVISQRTFDRVKIAKEYIEKKYRLKKEEEQEKKKDWEEIMSRMTQLNLAEDEAAKIKEEILQCQDLIKDITGFRTSS